MAERLSNTDGKTCTKCSETKPLSGFYSYGRVCKECTKRSVRENRAAKADYYRQKDRERAKRPDRVALREAYAKTERGKERVAAAKKAWRQRNPEKYRAHVVLNNALRDGKLVKPSRCQCGRGGRIHAHHHDYSKPLDVIWLCSVCHRAEHARQEAA